MVLTPTRTKAAWLLVIGMTGLFAGIIVLQASTARAMRNRVQACRDELRALEERQRESDQITKRRLAAMDTARAHEEAAARLRVQMENLRQASEAPRVAVDARKATSAPRFSAGSRVLASEFRNAGNATSEAALETVLWAAAGGDVDTLSKHLVFFDGNDRAAAQALLDGLPADVQARYQTPEKLLAAMAIPEAGTREAVVYEWRETDTPAGPARVVKGQFSTKSEPTTLFFASTSEGWKVVVTAGVVKRYAAQLRGNH